MAEGNLIYHSGTDWTTGTLTWPYPTDPEYVKVTALTIPMPDQSAPSPAYVSPDPRAGLYHGAMLNPLYGFNQFEFQPNMSWSDNPSVRMSIRAPAIPINTAETRYKLWFRRAYYAHPWSTYPGGITPWWRAFNKGYVALIHEGSAWTVLFIALSQGYYDEFPPSYPNETYMMNSYFDDTWSRTYINKCYTQMTDPSVSHDWPYIPYTVSCPATTSNTPYTVSRWTSNVANGFYENVGTFRRNAVRVPWITHCYVETGDFAGIDSDSPLGIDDVNAPPDPANFYPVDEPIYVTASDDYPQVLVFTQQPSASTEEDVAFAQQPVVEIRDSDDNLIAVATDEVTLVLWEGDGTLSGTATVAAVAGVATFSGLSIDTPGADKVLAAFADDTHAGASDTFAITYAKKLVFTQQPSASTEEDVAFAQQPVVEIRDSSDDLIADATDEVTLALTTGDGTLSGTATVAAVAGVATFTGLSIDTPGTDKVLTATATGIESADTSAFTIT